MWQRAKVCSPWPVAEYRFGMSSTSHSWLHWKLENRVEIILHKIEADNHVAMLSIWYHPQFLSSVQ